MPANLPNLPRSRGDDFLLAAPGDGWVEREVLVREMMRFVSPGRAHRTLAKYRAAMGLVGPVGHRSVTRDPLIVGSRQVANMTLQNGLRHGRWIREGNMIRHRDHPGAAWTTQEKESAQCRSRE